jgi:ABC-type nitrate/sulfonate/bicarbonate transport system permease component
MTDLTLPRLGRPAVLGFISVMGGLILWEVIAGPIDNVLFPTAMETLQVALSQARSGELWGHIGASLARVFTSWAFGGLLGVALGLLMASFRPVRYFFEPTIQFLRFVPAIAWITPFTIWVGVGEMSKIFLITYGVSFMVMLNTMTGVFTISANKLRAAQCFGAGPTYIFVYVTLPATVPYIVTGLRIGLGNGFMMLIAAEMLASEQGLGYLIFTSRLYMATDLIFLGILALGIVGILCDYGVQLVFRLCFRRFLRM